MKIIHCDGHELTVRDAGPIIFRLTARTVPIKVNGWSLVEDEDARRLLRDLIDTKLYTADRPR